MKVIFLQNIKGVAQMGDVKNVSDGYGRNFLLPRNLAKIATDTAMKEVDSLKKKAEALEKIKTEKAQQLARDIKDKVFEITRKASDKGKLFDGIERRDIAELLKEKVGLNIEEGMIKLEEQIKYIGNHAVNLELAPEIVTQVIIEVKTAE